MELPFTLIAGRSGRQGASAIRGKQDAEYRAVTRTIELCHSDLACLGSQDGQQVRVRSAHGEVVLQVRARDDADLPAGLAFMAYGPPANALIGGDTDGTGMPDAKGLAVTIGKEVGHV